VKGIASSLLALVVALETLQLSRADGLTWSSLNPFSSKKSTTPPPKKPNTNSASVPQLNGKPIRPPSPPPAQPSMLSKIGSAPATMWSKTKQVLTPSSKPAPSTASKFALGSQPKKAAAPTGSGSSWNPFASKTATVEPPHTTSEFIGRPRPTP
jgi:hypothetical protein